MLCFLIVCVFIQSPLFSDCDYEDRKYKHKTHFTPAYNPCLNCSCNNSLVRCLPIHCPPADLPCSQAMALPGQCCPTVCPSKRALSSSLVKDCFIFLNVFNDFFSPLNLLLCLNYVFEVRFISQKYFPSYGCIVSSFTYHCYLSLYI